MAKLSLKNISKRLTKYRSAWIAVTLTVLGAALIIAAKASVPTISLEPESGGIISRASGVDNDQASGGRAVKFFNSSCPYTAPTLADKWGAMNYVNYTFNKPDISQMSHDVEIVNNLAPNKQMFIQLYDGDIGASGQYYGIQSSGRVIWSQWNTSDTTNIRPGPGSYATNGAEGTPFISLRHEYGSLPAGHYKTRIVRAEFDGIGDWFEYYVIFPGGSEQHIGGIRFKRKTVGVPASFADGGGEWNEYVDNNGSTLLPVPLLQVNIKALANGTVPAAHADGTYSPMPNADMYVLDSPGSYIHFEIGATTGRCHPGDANRRLTLW